METVLEKTAAVQEAEEILKGMSSVVTSKSPAREATEAELERLARLIEICKSRGWDAQAKHLEEAVQKAEQRKKRLAIDEKANKFIELAKFRVPP